MVGRLEVRGVAGAGDDLEAGVGDAGGDRLRRGRNRPGRGRRR